MTTETGGSCQAGNPLTVTFYDVGQALSALVELPNGKRVLVDTGEDPSRRGCGACKRWHDQWKTPLLADLGGQPHIDLLWLTHQHSDHHGGLPGLLEAAPELRIDYFVDNATRLEKGGVKRARHAAVDADAHFVELSPERPMLPVQLSETVTLRPIVPQSWPANCDSKPNDCSIGLLVTYCESSILFTGDAEEHAEAVWDVPDINLLQVGHHGSNTSSSQEFIDRVKPEYAVISSVRLQTTGDGKFVRVPWAPPPVSTDDPPSLVNVNTATESELTALPGIGPALAARIVRYRELHGPFESLADLRAVSGIGSSKTNALAGLVAF